MTLSLKTQHVRHSGLSDMDDLARPVTDLPPEQQAIRAKCFHPTGTFVEFKKQETEQSIPERFEKIVRQFPDRVAVKTRNSTQTYDELNKVANRIARAILAKCGENNEPIAVLLEQGAAAIAAIFAALKAGKIVVPLDSSYPGARTSYMLEHSQAAYIVTNKENYSLASELARNGIKLLNIDDIDVSSPTGDPELSISPGVLAYILYTSGSTGQPKGVLQNHLNVLHQIMIYTNTLRICADDRLILLTSVTGQAINTMLVALLNGAAVYPFNIKDAGLARLAEYLGEEEITIFSSVPALFRSFAAALAEREQFPKLRLIYLGGEPIRKTDVELYKRRFFQDCLFVGRLGISEVGTVRCYFVDKETQIGGDLVPLGYAVEDMEILLLDDNGRKVGFDQIGEIAVKSRHLSPGYWRNPGASQAALVKDPKGGEQRIYLTGDLGRLSPDGCLIHCGRKDFRIKVRGYNVEPAEIERALLNTGSIKEAVVLGHEPKPGDQRLVAYLVPNQRPAPSLRTLRRALAEKLPDYMIPSAFVFMETLPRTPNTKIDRQALPPPDRAVSDREKTYVPPGDSVELRLTRIWESLLGSGPVGVTDNFFELGGESLLAARLLAEIENEFGKRLPSSSLFQSATIEHLAGSISQQTRLTPWSAVVALQPQGSRPPFFCVHELSGEILCYMNLARHLGQDQPFYAVHARGLDGIEEPLVDIQAMAACYIEGIRTVQPRGPYALGGFSIGGILAFEIAHQLREKGETVAMVALLDSTARSLRDAKAILAWDIVLDFFRDLPSWIKGSLQLNRAQWLMLIKLKAKMVRARLAITCDSSLNTGSRQDYLPEFMNEMGDLFSDQHRKIASALYRALREYKPRIYPGRLTLFRARMQPFFSSHKPDKGWSGLAAGGLDVKVVPGNHLGMLQEPHVKTLAKELRACLEKTNRPDASTPST